MKKYICPEIDIQQSFCHIMTDSLNAHNEVGDDDQFINSSFFDEMEDSYPPKDNSLWDDAYKNDK